MIKTYTAMIMAGGTGGHIFPGLAVAEALQQRGWRVFWLGSKEGMENRLIPQHAIPLETINIRGLRSSGFKRKLMMPFTLLRALLDAQDIFFSRCHYDVAIGFGGYTAFPGALIARLHRKNLIIHEQNSVAGLTNRLLQKIANTTLYGFPGVFPNPDGFVGNPVRRDIARLPHPQQRFKARQGRLRLLVIGGSLGAKIFNDIVPVALSLLPEASRPHVVHQSGVQQIDALRNSYSEKGIEADCRAFIDRIADEYARADIVLCRSGALTVSELASAGVGSLLVPFPYAVDNHQMHNATRLSSIDAAHCVPQTQFSAEYLAKWLAQLTREQCLSMALAARTLAKPDAAERIADQCETLVKPC